MPNAIDYDKQIEEMMTQFWSIEHLSNFTPEEMAKIKSAYELAREAHKSQMRKGGGPYITHPIAVAHILAEEFELGPNSIIAGFLHDVVEDTPYTIEDIRKLYGDDVAFLVGTVTKRTDGEYEMSKQMDNFKQMLSSIHYDIRALLVKLADRLHNMSTLSSMRPDKQMKISGETDYFYAPLANRLGLYEAKTKLENLSLQFRCPRDYQLVSEQIQSYRDNHGAQHRAWVDMIQDYLCQHGIEVRVDIKYRSPYTIWNKMQLTGGDFDHVSHKYVIQIAFADGGELREKDMCLKIYSLLTDICKELPDSVRNYIDSPKENGYQAFHFKALSPIGSWHKIHIVSERMVRNAKLGCVMERGAGVNVWLDKFRSVLKDMADNSSLGGFMEGVVSNFYNDDIFAFTPKGATVVLPKNSSVIDFAYEVHTDVGNHAQYARINGVVANIKTRLNRGDCVEVGTNPAISPRRDWLDHASTYKARRSIANAVRRYESEALPYERCSCCYPLPGEEVMGFVSDDGVTTIHKRNCPDAVRLSSQQGDNIINVEFAPGSQLYPVSLNIVAIDRFHLLSDLVNVVTEDLKLSIVSLTTVTEDEIVNCTINFSVHSIMELDAAIIRLKYINNIEEVKRVRR